MIHPDSTEHGVQRPEELVSWTGPERLRFLWYRLRLDISDINYASRRMVELQMRLPPPRPTLPRPTSKEDGASGAASGAPPARPELGG